MAVVLSNRTVAKTPRDIYLLKLPSRKIDDKDLKLILDTHKIEFSKTVELLRFIIDQHLTFKQHIEKQSRNAMEH